MPVMRFTTKRRASGPEVGSKIQRQTRRENIHLGTQINISSKNIVMLKSIRVSSRDFGTLFVTLQKERLRQEREL